MNQWITAKEAAKWSGKTENAIRILAHRHKWRRRRINNKTHYLAADVDRTIFQRARLALLDRMKYSKR